MLYWLSEFSENLRIFRYLTFRSAGAALTAMTLVIFLGPWVVRALKKFSFIAPLRLQGLVADEELDLSKAKTPSMGGLLIIFAIVVSTLLWAPLNNALVLLFIGNMLAYCAIGFYDDYNKVLYKNKDVDGGISAKAKLLLQFAVAGGSVYFITIIPGLNNYTQDLMVPFFKHPVVANAPIWIMIIFSSVVVVGASNAVNLTDGLDGLATGNMLIAAGTYVVFAYLSGNVIYSGYLNIPYIEGAGEVCVFGAAIMGACLGFLWHNCYPASMFMGDTGSLALGGSIGLIAVLVKQEVTLVIVGGVFVMETLSVVIQTSYFKYTRKKFGEGRRVFLMAPIHHHFQKKGWTETQVVIRFWILGIIFAG
ncbi:MAG: phospho-N-acetylmuramoyl-pentapeptide-transferase, partial [Lentisphaeraceae bacterium]|nr:phospho-N-acetylmuramoyl-pentapeptide-transferase [Lentisphaeraceae bacterium]